eukprot:6789415-Pyramimonas_sp.AAC.1
MELDQQPGRASHKRSIHTVSRLGPLMPVRRPLNLHLRHASPDLAPERVPRSALPSTGGR